MKNSSRSRGRPRTYDRQAALSALINVFWEKGYAQTSLEDLTAATGMNRPSLYAAFGDKDAMYLAAFTAYRDIALAQIEQALFADAELTRSLHRFYDTAIEIYSSGAEGPRGCMGVCIAATDAPHHPAIAKALQDLLKRIDALLEKRFALAVSTGDLPPSASVSVLAALAAATLHSLATRARAGTRRGALKSQAKDLIAQITAA